jgi:pyruvate kinase
VAKQQWVNTSGDLVIYVGGRFGEDCGASFIEISTVDKIIPKD